MKKLITVFVLILAQNVFSQDSIYKRNNEIIVSKIEEIGPSEVKFRKFNNLTGPAYIIGKSEIFRIKFENGLVDTMKISVGDKTEVVTQTPAESPKPLAYRKSIMYKNLSEWDLFLMIEKLPESDNKKRMLAEYKKMTQYKNIQYLSNGLGLGIGFAIPIGVTFGVLADYGKSYNGTSYDPATVIIAGALTGAAIRITGQVLTRMYKNKRSNAKKNLMLLYDELN